MEWMAYEREVGPLGPQRGDFHAAEIALGIYNANRGKRGKKLKLTDFILKWSERERGNRKDGDEDV